MGRPEPCVLYAHTFVHPHLDEYVDEHPTVSQDPRCRWPFLQMIVYLSMNLMKALVILTSSNLRPENIENWATSTRNITYAVSVVSTLWNYSLLLTLMHGCLFCIIFRACSHPACEFLEQNASSICPAVKLMGATSPPSFALEVFIQCEGEARFRRLCLPCLYSQSSSNVLEVEAVVTNHLVVRGSYRSLSMVIYGNTAEDLGQFNIEVDLDNTLTDTVSGVEGKVEDLPPAFHPNTLTIKEIVSPLKILSQAVVMLDLPLELRKFLLLVFKSLDSQNLGEAADTVISSLLSVTSICGTPCSPYNPIDPKQQGIDRLMSSGDADHALTEAGKELFDVYKRLQNQSGDQSGESSAESLLLESEAGIPTSKVLMDSLHQQFDFCNSTGDVGYPHLSQNKNTILWLSLACLLCSARESCFHFVSYGGMKQLGYIFNHRMQNSTSLTLLLLGVIEQATRHSIGCEGFLGWWPREEESIPVGTSDGYNQLLKLLLENQRHDVASLATYILHRLRFYEVTCRYEKLIKLSGPIDDPSPMAAASRSFILGDAGQLVYTTTSGLINLSNCGFLNWDIDSHLLSLLKDRGFLPLSAALLSSSILRSETGHAMDLFLDVVSHIEAIIISLLFCRSGLGFLLHDPEISSTIIYALRGMEDVQKEDALSLRYASVLMSKGFFCRPMEVGMIVEVHMKALIAIDSLCKSIPGTEEFLWVLWDLCRLSRSEGGRQALLVLVNFPEALKVLMTALHSGRELDPASLNTGVSPLDVAIFHSAADIFEVIVTDSTATSLTSWIDHAKELHMALHSSSPGSNKKDAPARLLEWIDAGVVYHRNGAIGLLRYAAVLASGGDVHMASNSVLASDMMDVDNVVGDSSSSSDGNVIDNLIGKRITEKDFPGIVLRDSSLAQLTTAFRILAFISDNSVVAAALYDEGAVMVVHAVMINCKVMLERSSNIYDYLVDEGAEGNSTSDLLLERNREKSLFDLLIPSLVLLINLLQKLQEAKEQHRNTKLMSALLQLHREVSPKLASCAAELSHTCPDFVLGFGAVCHLLASALACWPVYSWTPGLFHFLLDSLHATSLLALGPKETCSLLCLLNDLLPDESLWMWKNGIPMLSPLRAVAVGTLLGPEKEKQINWYLRPGNPEKLLAQLSQQLAKLGEVILHCAVSMSVVIQDILRVFMVRVACLNLDYASVLVKPIISWISHRLLEPSTLSDVDAYKVHQLLKFLAILLEHPIAKPLFLREGGCQMLTKVLERCTGAVNSDVKQFSENINIAKYESSLISWSTPVFRSISLISDDSAFFQHPGVQYRNLPNSFTTEECCIFWSYLLRFCMILPVGRELLACLAAFKEMGSSADGQSALLSFVKHIQSSTIQDSESQINRESDASYGKVHASEWKEHPPLLCCWTSLLRSIDSKNVPPVQVAVAIHTLTSGALGICMDRERLCLLVKRRNVEKSMRLAEVLYLDGKKAQVASLAHTDSWNNFGKKIKNSVWLLISGSVNLERVAVVKFLFGIKSDYSSEGFVEDNLKHIEELANMLESVTCNELEPDALPTPDQIKETANLFLRLLQKSSGTEEVDAAIASGYTSLLTTPVSSRIRRFANRSVERIEEYSWDDFGATFFWECPENLRNRLAQTGLSAKRKISSLEGANRHTRGDNSVVEATSQNTFSRGSVPVTTPPGPTRRDTFRQRKPNTSRPPSMHVDDYVARERNVDGNSSNVIAVPRIGSSSGRPPSIHVDVFMARQRERQGLAVNDAVTQVKTAAPDDNINAEKSSKPRQLKPDLDDDLQGIDIVFDAEESEPDDKLPFPQPDDNLQQPASVVIEQRSPHSIVEETESDVNESSQFSRLGTPLASNMDENTPSEYSSRMSASRPEMPLIREPSISSDKKFPDQAEDTKSLPTRIPNAIDSSAIPSSTAVAASIYMNTSSSSVRFSVDSRTPPNLYPNASVQQSGSVPLGTGLQGYYDQKFPPNQPPLPPMPPLQQSHLYYLKIWILLQFDITGYFNCVARPKVWTDISSIAFGIYKTSASSTPPPYSASSSLKNSTSLSPQYFQSVSNSELQQTSAAPPVDGMVNLSASRTMITSYPPPPLMQPLLFRPSSMPVGLYGNSLVPHHGENLANASQNLPMSLPSVQAIPALTQLQPLQPPQIPRPPPQHLRPPVPASPHSEQGATLLQSSLQIPAQPSQVLQQPQVSPAHVYYQTQQQENVSVSLQQQQVDRSQRSLQPSGDGTSQQQDSGMSLQEYFRSPEAIQSLLSDREKLCQLLEQHPKLMQMLQERLGQL
ncbi:protein virilizer [Sesamum angolense]|uniref:Protein virilizer n=1 Tax=Sesamum angolense TaxID=2727404 RepID=A0AAE2BSY5_9LAMI|nr:protein virilizer [Sesamum angolense]